MKIDIGSNHNGYEFKEEIKLFLRNMKYNVIDFGCYDNEEVDYPGIAFNVANSVQKNEIE